MATDKEVEDYLDQLEELPRQALEIAQQHLGSSFNVKRSNGLAEWKRLQVEIEVYITFLREAELEETVAKRREFGYHYRVERTDGFQLYQTVNTYVKSLDKADKEKLQMKMKEEGFRVISGMEEFLSWKEEQEKNKKKKK